MTSHHCGMEIPVSSKMGLFKTIMFNLEPRIGWFWDEPTSPARLGPRKNVCRLKHVPTKPNWFYVCLAKRLNHHSAWSHLDPTVFRKSNCVRNQLLTTGLLVCKRLVLALQRATIHVIANPSFCQASPTGKRNQLPWRHLPSVHR